MVNLRVLKLPGEIHNFCLSIFAGVYQPRIFGTLNNEQFLHKSTISRHLQWFLSLKKIHDDCVIHYRFMSCHCRVNFWHALDSCQLATGQGQWLAVVHLPLRWPPISFKDIMCQGPSSLCWGWSSHLLKGVLLISLYRILETRKELCILKGKSIPQNGKTWKNHRFAFFHSSKKCPI